MYRTLVILDKIRKTIHSCKTENHLTITWNWAYDVLKRKGLFNEYADIVHSHVIMQSKKLGDD